MKHFTKNLRWLLMSLLMFVGVGSAWADTSTLTFTAKCNGSGTADDGTVWTVTSDGTESTYDGTKGIHYGTGSAQVQYINLTTTGISGTITKVVVNASTASGVTATVGVTVGGSTFGGNAQSLSSSAADYSFEGSASGEIVVLVTKPSKATKALYVKSIVVTYSSGSSSDPSISADNVDIAYNATSGQIAYTVNNPVTGGSVSAATTSDWVTLGSGTTSPIAFTCSANSGASPRTATVTLTYAYGSNTKTKNVTITQTGNPDVVNNISDITDIGTYTVKGTIVAKNTRGFIVGDGTGYVYYYNQSYDQSAYNIGDKVKLSGSVVVYGGVYEFNSSTTITAATESNYVEENPTVISGSDMQTRVGSTSPAQLSSYVQYQGKLAVSGTHYNITIDDVTAQGSISYPISTDFTSLDGATVIVKGYFVGVSSSTYYNTMLGSIEAVGGFVAAPTFSVAEGEYSEAQTVEITSATSGATIYYTTDGTDPTTSSTQYTDPVTISTTTTLKAIASDGTNVSEITSATYTIDTRTELFLNEFYQDGTDTSIPAGSTITITVGETPEFTRAYPTTANGLGVRLTQGEIVYTGDNDALGTVDPVSGEITLVSGATGTLTVTATFAGNATYKGFTGYYKLKVNAATPTPSGDELFSETFAKFNGSGGRDDSYSGAVGSGATTDTDETGWSFEKCGGASKCLKFGTSTADATFTTRTIALTGDGLLTFSAAGWGDTKENKVTVTASEGTLSGDTDVTLDNGAWNDYTVTITGATGNLVLTFTGKRGFIDDIKVYTSTPDDRTATTVTLDPTTASYNVVKGEAFTAPTATLSPAAAGTLTYESSDETVATVDATGAVTILDAGTTTITAKFAGSDNYKPSQASYTITVTAPAAVITSLQALQEATTDTSQDVTLQLTDIYVTALKGTNNAYLSDGTYGALVYTNNHGLEAGKKFSGTLNVKSVLYKGATEITNFDASGLTITDGTLAPQTMTIDQITVANQSLPVKLENVTYDANAKTFSDGTNTIAYYDNFSVSPSLEDGKTYNVTGIVVMYNNLQIAPLAATDIVEVSSAVETTTTIDASGITNTDVNAGTAAGTLVATVALASDGSPVSGATVTWESSDTGVATIDADGVVTLVAAGTTDITAVYAGVSGQYEASTATYELTVTDSGSTPATGDYVKVTSDDDLTDGEYLIVYEEGSLAFDGSLETLDAVGNTVDVTIADNTIASTPTVDAATFTIEAATEGYTIKSASGLYIGNVSDANTLKSSADEAYVNVISFDAGNADIVSANSHLRYNSASNQTRFRYYKSSSYTNQKVVALYKKNSEPDTRTATTVTLDPATASYNVVLGEAFTAPTATLDPAAAGTLTYVSSDETVATVDATGAVTILDAGTTTITAKFAGNDDYKPSQASYTITVTAPATVITSLQALQEATTSTEQDVTLQLTDIYVTALKGTNNAYLSDGTYGALVYTDNHGLEAGKKFSGTLNVKSVIYKGATEIKNFDATGLTITDGTLAPQTMTIDQITVANQSLPVKLENVTYDATNSLFTDGTNTIKYYDNFSVSPTLVDGHVYNVTGIIVMYNNLQIAPLAATDVEDITAPVLVEAPTFDPAGGTYTTDLTVTISCATENTYIYYTLDGSDPDDTSTPYTEPLTITETTTVKAIAYDDSDEYSAITTAVYTINKPEVPYAKEINTNYFEKVFELASLESGDKVIIVNEEYESSLSVTQQTNNRLAKGFEYTPYQYGNFARFDEVEDEGALSSMEQFIVVREGDNFYFYANNGETKGYIYAASSSSNWLRTKETKDDNAKAAITFDENGNANIVFQGTNTRNTLRFNQGSNLFSCYSSGQKPVQIYVETWDPAFGDVQTLTMPKNAPDGSSWMTWVAPYDLSVPNLSDADLEAYIVKVNDTQTEAEFVRVYNIPASTPIILHSSGDGEQYLMQSWDDELDDVSENALKISDGYHAVGDYDEDAQTASIYVLNFLDIDGDAVEDLGFYPLKKDKVLAAGKAYIELQSGSPVKFLGADFGDATGINTIDADNPALDGVIYNLSGQRVTNPTRGIYIVNGKKVLIK